MEDGRGAGTHKSHYIYMYRMYRGLASARAEYQRLPSPRTVNGFEMTNIMKMVMSPHKIVRCVRENNSCLLTHAGSYIKNVVAVAATS